MTDRQTNRQTDKQTDRHIHAGVYRVALQLKIPKTAQYLAVQVLHSHFPAENISKAVTFGSPYKTLLAYAKINSTGTQNILV